MNSPVFHVSVTTCLSLQRPKPCLIFTHAELKDRIKLESNNKGLTGKEYLKDYERNIDRTMERSTYNVDMTVSAESDKTGKQIKRGLQALLEDQDVINVKMISKIEQIEDEK